LKFKKRIRGTPKQIGKPFPIGEKKKLPRKLRPVYIGGGLRKSKALVELAKAERDGDPDRFYSVWDKLSKDRKVELVKEGYVEYETEGDYEHGYHTYPQGTDKLLKILRKGATSKKPKVTPESERASEWYAKRYPLMFKGGKRKSSVFLPKSVGIPALRSELKMIYVKHPRLKEEFKGRQGDLLRLANKLTRDKTLRKGCKDIHELVGGALEVAMEELPDKTKSGGKRAAYYGGKVGA